MANNADYKNILFKVAEGVAEIRLNRPHRLNAVVACHHDRTWWCICRTVRRRLIPQSAHPAGSGPRYARAASERQDTRRIRGKAGVDREAIAELLVKVSNVVMDNPEICEIDLNPVIAHPNGYTIVDSQLSPDRGRPETRKRD